MDFSYLAYDQLCFLIHVMLEIASRFIARGRNDSDFVFDLLFFGFM